MLNKNVSSKLPICISGFEYILTDQVSISFLGISLLQHLKEKTTLVVKDCQFTCDFSLEPKSFAFSLVSLILDQWCYSHQLSTVMMLCTSNWSMKWIDYKLSGLYPVDLTTVGLTQKMYQLFSLVTDKSTATIPCLKFVLWLTLWFVVYLGWVTKPSYQYTVSQNHDQ